jgi:hypothetical protein
MVTYHHVTYGIIDTGKRFHDRVVAEKELPIGWGIHPDRAMNHGMLASMLIQRCQHPDKPAWPSLHLVHNQPVNQSLDLGITFEFFPDLLVIHELMFL